MELSPVGLALFALLYVVGWRLGSGPLYGLMLSVPFGSTAFVALPALGGATPLVYALFAIVLVAQCLVRRDSPAAGAQNGVRALGEVFARQPVALVVLAAMLVAGAGAIALPRLFAGETVVLRSAAGGGYVEAPLAPSSKNVTQCGYFLIDALVFFALSTMLLARPRRALIVGAFFAWCIVHTVCGTIDLLAKYAGWGDVFAAIRTANYITLSEVFVAGFPRLTGPLPEASTFAMMTLACLAFAFAYWRHTRSRLALALALANLVLILLSTSTTAYVGLPILCLPLLGRIAASIRRSRRGAGGRERLERADGQVVVFALASAAILLAVAAVDADLLRPYFHMLGTRLIERPSSPGGIERMHFNELSLRNFVDTRGMGVGLGGSRASSWPVAVLSQLGLVGAALLGVLAWIVLRGMRDVDETGENRALIAAGESICAAAAGGMLGASLSGGSANPGVVFYVALAVATSWRVHAASASASARQGEA